MSKKRPPAPPTLNRREALRLGAAAASLALLPLPGCGPGEPPTRHLNSRVDPSVDGAEDVAFAPEELPHDEALFAVPVTAGAMRADSALVHGHTSDTAPKRLRVWREGSEPGRKALVLNEDVTPNDGGHLALSVTGLAPATWYSYAFLDGDGDEPVGRSLIGRFRTAFPEDWLFPVRIGALSCTRQRNQPWVTLERAAEEEVDCLVHLGDFSYNDGAVTLDEYREIWRGTLSDPGYQALLPRAGLYASWDDHEFDNDLDPELMHAAQLQAAKDAFFEAVPAERGPDGELWTSYRWGRTVEIFVVDSRSERKRSLRQQDVEAYLGAEQLAWLKQGLKDSPCHFKVLLNSVPVTRMSSLWANAIDRWQGYEPAREELLSFLVDEDIDNVWFLSGDFHMGFVGRVEPEGPRRKYWEIAAGPSGNVGNPLGFLVEQGGEAKEDVFPSNQFLYGRGRMAVTTLSFDPILDGVRVRFIDGDSGEVLFDQLVRAEE